MLCFIYDYQSLIAGIMALIAGAAVYLVARNTFTQQLKEKSYRQKNFAEYSIVIVEQLEENLTLVMDAFSNKFDDFDDIIIKTPRFFDEVWKLDFELPKNIIENFVHLKESVLKIQEIINTIKKNAHDHDTYNFGIDTVDEVEEIISELKINIDNYKKEL